MNKKYETVVCGECHGNGIITAYNKDENICDRCEGKGYTFPYVEQLESELARLREAIENLQCLTPSRVEYGNCDCQVCRIKHDKLKEEK